MQRLAVLCLIAVLVACTSAPGPSSEPRSGRPTADATGSPLPSAKAGNVLDGQIAYVGGADPQIHLLDLASGESLQLTHLRPEHAELTGVGPMRPALSCFFGPSGLRWSPDGERLAFSYSKRHAIERLRFAVERIDALNLEDHPKLPRFERFTQGFS